MVRALRPSLFSLIGLRINTGALIGGSLVIGDLQHPGIGSEIVTAVIRDDFPVVLGAVVVIATGFVHQLLRGSLLHLARPEGRVMSTTEASMADEALDEPEDDSAVDARSCVLGGRRVARRHHPRCDTRTLVADCRPRRDRQRCAPRRHPRRQSHGHRRPRPGRLRPHRAWRTNLAGRGFPRHHPWGHRRWGPRIVAGYFKGIADRSSASCSSRCCHSLRWCWPC